MCNCRHELNEKIKTETGFEGHLDADLISGKTYTPYRYEDNKGKKKEFLIFHSFCPFCGQALDKTDASPVQVTLSERERAFLKQYAKVYESERHMDSTADPIVLVEDVFEVVVNPDFGGTEVWTHESDSFRSIEDLMCHLRENFYETYEIDAIMKALEADDEAEDGDIKHLYIAEFYKPVAFFLTRLEAEKYCIYQKHNLKKPRVYTHHMGYANDGDLLELMALLKSMGDQLLGGRP